METERAIEAVYGFFLDLERQVPATHAMTANRLTVLAFVTVIVLGGLNGIAAKQLLGEVEPFWSGAIRFAIAGLLMLAIVIATRRALPRGRRGASWRPNRPSPGSGSRMPVQ